MRLDGKVAIITGAGQTAGEGTGNGRATAITFAREGATLVLANRSLPSLQETHAIIAAEGFEAHCVQADVRSEDDCAHLMEEAVGKFDRIDILHNNVGIARSTGLKRSSASCARWRSYWRRAGRQQMRAAGSL